MTFLLEIAIGLILGAILGLLGGGGALLTILVLLYVFHYSLLQSIGTSLFLVVLGALPAVLLYASKGQLKILPAVYLGAGGALGAIAGSYLGGVVPTLMLFILLLVMMGLSVILMFKPSTSQTPSQTYSAPGRLILPGLFIGTLTGMLGVGGGFLIVPALYMFTSLQPREAIATSLAIIVVNSFFGMLGHWQNLPFENADMLILGASYVLGGMLGFQWSFRVSQKWLKQGFGVLLLILIAILIAFPPF